MSHPFSEAKYKALLEGLRITEIMFSVPNHSNLMRLEAEFYTAKTFNLLNHYTGNEITEFIQYGTSDELNEDKEGYPILRVNEFESYFIGQPTKYCNLIDASTFKSLKLKKEDVLICRTNGNPMLVGKSALVPMDYDYAYASYLVSPQKVQVRVKVTCLFRREDASYLIGIQGEDCEYFPLPFNPISIINCVQL